MGSDELHDTVAMQARTRIARDIVERLTHWPNTGNPELEQNAHSLKASLKRSAADWIAKSIHRRMPERGEAGVPAVLISLFVILGLDPRIGG